MLHGNFEGHVPGILCHQRFGNWRANPELQKSQGFLAVQHFPCKDLILAPSISLSSMDFYSKAKLHFRKINGYSLYWRLFGITKAISFWKAWRYLTRIRSRYYSTFLNPLTLDILWRKWEELKNTFSNGRAPFLSLFPSEDPLCYVVKNAISPENVSFQVWLEWHDTPFPNPLSVPDTLFWSWI